MRSPFPAALPLALALSACGGRAADEAPPPPLVRTVLVGAAGSSAARYTGTVHARIEADLGFRVDGKITGRLVDPGQAVRRGQPLFRLDAADLALAAGAAGDRLRAAQADAVRAAADEARLRDLVAAGAVSRAAYDTALAARRGTAASLSAARAAAAQAGNQRGYAVLVADGDGVVTDVLAQPGQVVAAGTPVVRLARAGPREAVIAVAETAVRTLPREGVATLYGQSGQVPARLREVSGSADPATRTFAARYTLAGVGAGAPLGATVTVALPGVGGEGVSVPLAALVDDGRGPGVWLVGAGGRVHRRRVAVAAFGDEAARLAPGALRPGERIVALGAQLLREGERVRIAPGAPR